MRSAYMLVFQNGRETLSDAEMYRTEIRLAELAEPLGFDVIWSVEHHSEVLPEIRSRSTRPASRVA